MSTKNSQQDLGSLILANCPESKFPGGEDQLFSPRGALKNVVTKDAILRELNFQKTFELLGDDDKRLVEFIRNRASKLFAICVISILRDESLKVAMRMFKASRITDERLPISINTLESNDDFLQSPWTWPIRRNFKSYQGMFLDTVFSDSNVDIVMHPEAIFPFTRASKLSEGGFGTVYQVTIHRSHVEWKSTLKQHEVVVAVKELKGSVDENSPQSNAFKAWEREKDALKWARDLGHPNMIEVKAIISKGGRQYFVFPLADGGNLVNFCQSPQNLRPDDESAKHIVEQLSGVAEALDKLHCARFRHGDLKPENILIQDETWKITDMGLAKFHEEVTKKRLPTVTRLGGTVSYEPPESFDDPKPPTSRLADIWSMGCIILQLSTCLLNGYKALEELEKKIYDRKAKESFLWHEYTDGKRAVHPAVLDLIEGTIKDSGDIATPGFKAIISLLRLVRNRLLVVELPSESNSSSKASRGRADAKELHSELQKIFREIEKNTGSKKRTSIPLPLPVGFDQQGSGEHSQCLIPPSTQATRQQGPHKATSGLWGSNVS